MTITEQRDPRVATGARAVPGGQTATAKVDDGEHTEIPRSLPIIEVRTGHALDLIEAMTETPDLIVTDPPYAFGNTVTEHAISATVATVLRESARRLRRGRWMLVMCAASWRSTAYMVEAVRGIVEPVRMATWCKPRARTKVDTEGWKWASVNVIAFRKGKADDLPACNILDHITAEPVMNGRRAELPPEVARWMVQPYAVPGGLMLDPFSGSGALVRAAAYDCGMRALGFEINPPDSSLAIGNGT